MKKLCLLAVLAGVGALGFSQTPGGDGQIDRPWRIHVGAFFPTDASLKALAGNSHFAVGGSYDFRETTYVGNVLFHSFYADGTFGNKSGGRSSVYGGGYQLRYAFGTPGKPLNTTVYPYVGGGLGLYLVDDNVASTSTSFRLGGKLLAGLETPQGWFLEAVYSLVGSTHGYQPSGFTAAIGYRF